MKTYKDNCERAKQLKVLIWKICATGSIRELSRQSGVTAAYICNISKGKYIPSADVLAKISNTAMANEANVDIYDLMMASGYLTQPQTAKDYVADIIKKGLEQEVYEMLDFILQRRR